MKRHILLAVAAALIATPALATGFLLDLPNLTYPQIEGAVTQSTAGPVPVATVKTPD